MLEVSFFLLQLWHHGVELNCDVTADVDHGWDECAVLIGSDINAWNICFNSGLILSYCLYYFTFYVIKGIKNGCQCIVEIRGIKGLCLGYIAALAYCSCMVSDQGTALHASDLHNAQQLYFISLTVNIWKYVEHQWFIDSNWSVI